MSVVGDTLPVQPKRDFRSKRTEAVRKHTLFGSDLELYSQQEKDEMKKIDLEAVHEQEEKDREENRRRRRCAKELPDYLRLQLSGGALKGMREGVAEQKKQAARSESMLKMLEDRSKYYEVGIRDAQRKRNATARSEQWITERDVEHADDINDVGLSARGSFNRHKYRTKPPVHEYSIIGDPLEFGMEFGANQPIQPTAVYPEHRRGSQHRVPREAYMHKPKERQDLPKMAVDVPQNIRHMFGSRICANLLSDTDKVESTIKEQKEREAQLKRSRLQVSASADFPRDPQLNPQYESIGNILRQDIFPGLSTGHKIGTHKRDFTQDVHSRRVPCPDEYRYHRDHLSTWAEQNVLRDRVKKAWNDYLSVTAQKTK